MNTSYIQARFWPLSTRPVKQNGIFLFTFLKDDVALSNIAEYFIDITGKPLYGLKAHHVQQCL